MQVGWIPYYLADLRADFWRFFGIDLQDCDLDSRSFVELAQRVSAYSGVMSARVEEAREGGQGSAPAARAPSGGGQPGVQQMDVASFRLAFPGVLSVAKVSAKEVE